MKGLVAREEVEEQVGLVERPFLFGSFPTRENAAEQRLRGGAIEEMLLVRRPLIGVARRNRNAVDPHAHHIVKKPCHALRIGLVEERGVDDGPEAGGFRFGDG